jgi:predicted 3-demethylubiquinone-9 3-methyltransferase (glyoxalase superfamily)
MQKVSPFLWFDDQAEEAANFYVSVFKNSKMGSVMRYDAAAAKAANRPEGSVLTVSFQLEGTDF